MTHDDESGRTVARGCNKNYAADVNFSMRYTRWFLTLLGIWPDVTSNPVKIEKCVSKFLKPFPPVIITLLIIPMASIPIVRDQNTTQFLLVLAPVIVRSASVIKFLILVSRRETIKSCIQHMETDWSRIDNDNDREIMMRNSRLGRSVTTVCLMCQYSGAILYNIMPFVTAKKNTSVNGTGRPITVPGIDIYVDLRAGHNYEIVILASCFSIFFVSAITVTICNLAVVLACHACGQIQIVMSRLDGLIDNEDGGKDPDRVYVQKRITFIIQSHVRVLKFASKIDEVLQELCLIEVLAATLMICLVEWLCLLERKSASLISNMVLLVAYSFNLFIFCQIGELLKEQCQAVGDAAYMTEWYKLPEKTGLALVLLITTANYPRKLTAGGIVDLSIMTFRNVSQHTYETLRKFIWYRIMRTSLGYVNMLRTMTEI